MDACKGNQGIALIAAILLSVLTMGGCASYNQETGIKYSYDTKASFSERKSYGWEPPWGMYGRDPLLEANVQTFTDQILTQKGFTRTSEKPDLTLSTRYEIQSSGGNIYRIQSLNLNIYKTEGKELVWRGTAFGTIRTDAASGELKQTVQGILSNFPPN